MKSYIFVLGTTSFELCQAELISVLDSLSISYTLAEINKPLVSIETAEKINAQRVLGKLGGCVKIAQILGEFKSPQALEIANHILREEKEQFTFGLSFYSPFSGSLDTLHTQIKELLVSAGRRVRFILPRRGLVLSSVVVAKQHVSEYVLFFKADSQTWKLARTLAVQDADEWTWREFSRPAADPKSGMVPVKVARMMVNLAFRQIQSTQLAKEKPTLLDPFCGMGTILVEALLLGWHVIGSDHLPEVVDKTQKNIDWILTRYTQIHDSSFKLFVSDATHISERMPANSVAAIVTEPYMGRVIEKKDGELWQKGRRLSEAGIRDMLKGLKKLYIGALRDWHQVLESDGCIVVVIPQVEMGKRNFSVKNLIDTCEKLGYTLTQGPYTYARPQATVKRQIYVFKKLSSD